MPDAEFSESAFAAPGFLIVYYQDVKIGIRVRKLHETIRNGRMNVGHARQQQQVL